MKIYTLCAPAFLVALFACTKSGSSGGGGSAPKPTQTPSANQTNCSGTAAAATWQGGISTIFQTNCLSCHATYGTYAVVVANINNIVYRIDTGSMPKGKAMSTTDKAAIHAWITAGKPELNSLVSNSAQGSECLPTPTPIYNPYATPTPIYNPYATPTPVPGALVPTYSGGIQSIMATYCISCHGKYASQTAVSSEYNQIMSKVNSGAMPRGTTMPIDKIQLMRQWGSYPNAPYGRFAP